ncbi:MAG: domain protein AcuB [Labilithrix sp.]|nr:domain protein AcuB [Labilithrix sp.]
MQPNVLTVTSGLPASDAWALMDAEGVRHAVVTLGGEIIGVLSDRDLGGPHGGATRRRRLVADLMHVDATTASPGMSIERAAALVREERIGCLPIVERGRLVGIVTRSDLVRALEPRRAPTRPVRPDPGAAEIVHPPAVSSPNIVRR